MLYHLGANQIRSTVELLFQIVRQPSTILSPTPVSSTSSGGIPSAPPYHSPGTISPGGQQQALVDFQMTRPSPQQVTLLFIHAYCTYSLSVFSLYTDYLASLRGNQPSAASGDWLPRFVRVRLLETLRYSRNERSVVAASGNADAEYVVPGEKCARAAPDWFRRATAPAPSLHNGNVGKRFAQHEINQSTRNSLFLPRNTQGIY